MANQVLIDIMNPQNYDAGTKARNDVALILKECGFHTTVMFNRTHNKFLRTLELFRAANRMGKDVKENEIIVLQYPYQAGVMCLALNRLEKIKERTKCRVVVLIHDVLFLRNETDKQKDLNKLKETEVGFFNRFDGIIAHNYSMKNELTKAGVCAPIFELGIFDYIYDGQPALITRSETATVIFAGNLSPQKSGFLYRRENTINNPVNLYGSKPAQLEPNYTYKGSYPPNTLIEKLEGNYGLVWDGPSTETCSGTYGNYLRYNNPHKFSLYIAAGLPVIVWEGSALADYVKANKIGIVVKSLSEIKNIPCANSNEYNTFLVNVNRLKQKACKGEMLKAVIKKIIEGTDSNF